MTAIELKGAGIAYPEFKLGPIDLAIEKGEFFGIFGPPSTGKTSILKLILGLVSPDEGAVLLGGQDARELDVAARDISMVFQNLALFPHMTGRENIIFPLTENGAPEAEVSERLDFVSEVLHVGHILHKNPAQMSGGERQRIALGRAFAAHSTAMLLDEPIAALDARLREEMRVELKRLQRENNQTFVYVSHDEEEVMAISDRVAVVIDGQIAQVGAPEDVYSRPNSIAVAKVIGTPPMNLFEGEILVGGSQFTCPQFSSIITGHKGAKAAENVSFGVRPEDIWICDLGEEGAIEVTISSTEPLGGYTIVNAVLGGQMLKIRAPGQVHFDAEAKVGITFDQRRIHLFGHDGASLLVD